MAKMEEIINYLQNEGLMPKKDEDGDIVFKYQMKNFIIFDTTDDEQYLQIALPGIYDVTLSTMTSFPAHSKFLWLPRKVSTRQ